MAGYVKLHRQMTEWEWYQDTYVKCLFLHLLLCANYEDKRWRGKMIFRGQLVTSLAHLSEGSGLSIRQIRTALGKLSETGEIITETTNKFTVITICKFDFYQSNEEDERQTSDKQATNERQSNDNQTTNKRQTNDNQTTTTKEYKEYKEDNNSSSSSCARERDEFERMKEEDGMIELVAMLNHISKEEVLAKIDEFKAHCQVGMNEHASQGDIRRHFRDWVRIRISEEKKQQYGTKNKQNNPRGEFEPTPNADYSAPI